MGEVIHTYEIRVAAVLDRSTAAAAGDFVQTFTRAHQSVGRSEVAEQTRTKRYVAAIKDRYFAEEQRKEEQAVRAQAKRQEAAQQHVARIKDRYFADQQRAEDKANATKEREAIRSAEKIAKTEAAVAKRALEERRQAVRQIASDSFNTVQAVASKALGVGKEIAGGMGVNFSVGAGVARAVQLQRMAVEIVNAGNRGAPGEDRNAKVNELQDQARSIGNKYAFDPTKMLAGYAQFQAKTGDTETASAGLDRFAKLAKAMNVQLDDMISMAGEVSSKLEDGFKPGEQRAQKVYEIIKALTAQGQEGAIEIADLAKETARIGGGAGFFKGDVGETIVKLGSLAQLARQTGGANSAADAARAVAAFVTTLKTPARRKAFEANDVTYKDETGAFLSPFEIIKNALKATQGDTEKMNEMFKSSLGTKPVDALAKEFNRAGKGDAGLAAVDKLLAKFSGSVSEDVINENLGRAMQTTESKAQVFQNKLDAITASMADRVLPAFERLAPTVEKTMRAFSDVVAWSANNPGQAITLAIVGSIAKASIGPMIGKTLVDLIAGNAGAGGAAAALDPLRKGPGGLPMGTSNVAGSALAIGTIAVTTFTVGSMIVDKMVEGGAKGDTKTIESDLKNMEFGTILAGAVKTGQASEADKQKAWEDIQALTARIQAAKGENAQILGGSFGAMLRAGENYITGNGPSYSDMKAAQNDSERIPELESQLNAMKTEFTKFTDGTIKIVGKVEVTNPQAFGGNGGGGVGGREGVPDHS